MHIHLKLKSMCSIVVAGEVGGGGEREKLTFLLFYALGLCLSVQLQYLLDVLIFFQDGPRGPITAHSSHVSAVHCTTTSMVWL